MDAGTEQRLVLKRRFTDFLDSDHGHGNQVLRLKDMMARKQTRLLVELNDLRAFDADLTKRLLTSPAEYLGPFEEALEEVVRNTDPKYLAEGQRVKLGWVGSFGFHRVTPRQLLAGFLGSLVQVEGIVTKCSVVRPKVVTSVHYCADTGAFTSREYRDATSFSGPPTNSVYPTKDDNGHVLTTEYGLCTYRDSQSITLQEMPESAPPGQLPRSVDVVLEDDLVDRCKPGDRVLLVGVYKALPSAQAAAVSGVFRTLVVGTSLTHAKAGGEGGPTLDFATASRIRALVDATPCGQLFELLGDSLAPSICGHGAIKRALILLLLGGLEKNLANGGHLRGDINCLMVGDPSVAKSQLLRAIMHVAPLAISTTGRGSSGVGLTAAVTSDGDTGERRLEAGAMVLADGGVVCIDEFDKMSDADRVAIHEVMEQQTVTIAKAGIHASLNARCSVVAAANPIYGSYDMSLTVTRNVALPDSLLSRFDLLFIVLDQTNAAADREIAQHVLTMHAFRPPGDDGSVGLEGLRGEADAAAADDEAEAEAAAGGPGREAPSIYAKPVGRGARRRTPLSVSFLKKFIAFAKHRPRKPALTPEAMEHIAASYADWRKVASEDRNSGVPVTARTLETMIRLATAHAKMRLGNDVTKEDADAALGVMRFALGAEEVSTRRAEQEAEGAKKDAAAAAGGGGAPANGGASNPRVGAGAAGAAQPVASRGAAGGAGAGAAAAEEAMEEEEAGPPGDGGGGGGATQGDGGEPSPVAAAAQEAVFKVLLSLLMRRDECTLSELEDALAAKRTPFARATIAALCTQMAADNKVMFVDDTIYKI